VVILPVVPRTLANQRLEQTAESAACGFLGPCAPAAAQARR
jgi:hypothetical protein